MAGGTRQKAAFKVVKQCTVILTHVEGNHIEIACPHCKANVNSNGDFINGIPGMAQHLKDAHHIIPSLQEGQTIEHYIEDTCKIRDVDWQDVARIRKGLLNIVRRYPLQAARGPPRRLTYEEVPEHTHIVQFTLDGVREDFHRKLYCVTCGKDASNKRKYFNGINGFANHMRGHGLEIGKGEAEVWYVYEKCPYKRLSARELLDVMDNGMEMKWVHKERKHKGQELKRKRDEMEEKAEGGEETAGELQAPPLKQLALRPKQAHS